MTDAKIIDYYIVQEVNPGKLSISVAELITEEDWQPYGSAFEAEGLFYQPMVRFG